MVVAPARNLEGAEFTAYCCAAPDGVDEEQPLQVHSAWQVSRLLGNVDVTGVDVRTGTHEHAKLAGDQRLGSAA
eukprot:9487975-Pyramimonas_sp.AAC.1